MLGGGGVWMRWGGCGGVGGGGCGSGVGIMVEVGANWTIGKLANYRIKFTITKFYNIKNMMIK